jgi:hypothetical protein
MQPFYNRGGRLLGFSCLIYFFFMSVENHFFHTLFICCPVLVNKIGLSLSRKIHNVLSNTSLFLKKRYEQRGHLCYMLNIKGYFGIIYPTTIKKHNIHQGLRHNHYFENLLATVSLKVIRT